MKTALLVLSSLATIVGFAIGAGFWSFLPIALYLVVANEDWVANKLTSGESSVAKLHHSYQELLQALTRDPSNSNLRQSALRAGRILMEATKGRPGYPEMSEASLRNDLDAVCASSSTSPTAEIEKMAALVKQGVISAAEFERGKARFLGSPPDQAAAATAVLKKLHELMLQGVLSESEFNSKKWDILAGKKLS